MLSGGFVRTAGHRRFSRLKPNLRVRAVAKWLGGGTAAAAQRERLLRNLVRIPIPIHHRHVVAFHAIRPVLSNPDRHHVFSPEPIADRRWPIDVGRSTPSSALPPGTPCCSSSCPSYRAAAPS